MKSPHAFRLATTADRFLAFAITSIYYLEVALM